MDIHRQKNGYRKVYIPTCNTVWSCNIWFWRHITQFHEKLDIILEQDNHYAVDLYGLDNFLNNNVPNPFEGDEDPYTGP